MLQKTNAEGYAKDLKSGMVVNNNQHEYAVYIQNRERAKKMREIENEIAWLKRECIELRTIISNLNIGEKN
jgi:hypothetical protein